MFTILSCGVKRVEATIIEVQRTFFSDTADGCMKRSETTYTPTHDGASGSIVDPIYVGQWYSSPNYYEIDRGMVFFDTSAISSSCTILNATLSLYVSANWSVTDFNVTIQNGQPNYPHKPLLPSDYYYNYYSGDGGNRNTTEITGLGYWNITFSSTGNSWITKGGWTKLCLKSNRDITPTAPTGEERVVFKSRESGEAYAPTLYVWYETEGYNYLVHGPYWESGSVATEYVNVSLSIENTDPLEFQLNGTGGTADSENIQIEQRGIAFTWNFTDYMNYSRTYYLTSVTFEEIWLFIPNTATESVNIYTFSVTDLLGVTNAYLETVHSVGGQSRIVERQSLAVINDVPFWMVWAKPYDVRLRCDLGTYDYDVFLPLGEQSQSLIIMQGMFVQTYPGLDVAASAKRMNSTGIQVRYVDNAEKTIWLLIEIKYKVGFGWETAYSLNTTGNDKTVDWNSGVSTQDYVTVVTACRTDGTFGWSFSCPKPKSDVNPFEGLEGLGTWPIPAKQVIGLFLVLCVFGVFSYIHMPLGCVLGCIMAGFLTLIGWLDINWIALSFAFSLAIMAAIVRSKREVREI